MKVNFELKQGPVAFSPEVRRANADVYSHQRGFGLLETLVAMVLFAGVGVVTISWLQQSLSTAVRLKMTAKEDQARLYALSVISSTDLWANPAGSVKVGEFNVNWTGQPAGPDEMQIGYPIGFGKHNIRLVKLQITIQHEGNRRTLITDELLMTAHQIIAPAKSTSKP